MTTEQEGKLFLDCCIQCGEPLSYEMDSDGRFTRCCDLTYSTPLVRADIVTVTDGEGEEYE
jgi:hypothetical protein